MTTPSKPRLVARLRDPELLRDALEFNGLTIRELAERCGSQRHRATIGHLHSGKRNVCSVHLAGRITKVLRVPTHHLFALVSTNPNVEPVGTWRPAA